MNLYLLSMPSRRELKVGRRLVMYTGTLIDDLIATVERAEQHAYQETDSVELDGWYTVAPHELGQAEPNLIGVA